MPSRNVGRKLMTSRPNDPKPKGPSPAPADPVARILADNRKGHHPDCIDESPHFVPPSLGQIGFYPCCPPDDLRNHTRCRPPYDHEHDQHIPEEWVREAQEQHQAALAAQEEVE